VGSSVVNTAEAVESDFEWILLTNEPIDTFEQVEQIVKDYEHRWLIEEFHKCWKTGCRLEGRPLESLDAIERMMTITAPIAVRLLQVHTAARSMNLDGETATTTLSDNELKCLWASTEKTPYPRSKPSGKWVLHAIAKLGAWQDTKRTGRIGWATLWYGWSRFNERLEGWNMAQQAAGGRYL
jgi:hypothetical protein